MRPAEAEAGRKEPALFPASGHGDTHGSLVFSEPCAVSGAHGFSFLLVCPPVFRRRSGERLGDRAELVTSWCVAGPRLEPACPGSGALGPSGYTLLSQESREAAVLRSAVSP